MYTWRHHFIECGHSSTYSGGCCPGRAWAEWGLSYPERWLPTLVAVHKLFNLSIVSSSENRHSNNYHLIRWTSGWNELLHMKYLENCLELTNFSIHSLIHSFFIQEMSIELSARDCFSCRWHRWKYLPAWSLLIGVQSPEVLYSFIVFFTSHTSHMLKRCAGYGLHGPH